MHKTISKGTYTTNVYGETQVCNYSIRQHLLDSPSTYYTLALVKGQSENEVPFKVHTSKKLAYLTKIVKELG